MGKPSLSRVDAARRFLDHAFTTAQRRWPELRDGLSPFLNAETPVDDEMARFILGLAIIAVEGKALANLATENDAQAITLAVGYLVGSMADEQLDPMGMVNQFEDAWNAYLPLGDTFPVLAVSALFMELVGQPQTAPVLTSKPANLKGKPALLLVASALITGFWKGLLSDYSLS